MPLATGEETRRRREHPRWRASAQRLIATLNGRYVGAVFQPIVRALDGQVIGLEALSRPHGPSAFSHAGELFETADDLGLLWPLERLTRSTTLEAIAPWPEDVRLFLNCAPAVVMDDRFVADISLALSGCELLSAERVVLELTERSDSAILPGLPGRVRELRSRGFEIAIDDVGAGTSGLHMIASIRPDWIKIDRLLVTEIDRDSYRRDLLRSLARFAGDRGIRVVAEGVERPEELSVVLDLGIEFAQGFLLGRPEGRVEAGLAA